MVIFILVLYFKVVIFLMIILSQIVFLKLLYSPDIIDINNITVQLSLLSSDLLFLFIFLMLFIF